jgi:hypothetical protein
MSGVCHPTIEGKYKGKVFVVSLLLRVAGLQSSYPPT